MAKRCLKPVCRAMEILKGIESMFRRKMSVIAQSMKHIVRVYQLKILDILESLRKTLRSTKQSDLTLDLIAALRVVETTFHGTESLSFTRLMLSSLCFDVLTVKGMLRSKEINMARLCFLSLETLHDWQNRSCLLVIALCSGVFPFWIIFWTTSTRNSSISSSLSHHDCVSRSLTHTHVCETCQESSGVERELRRYVEAGISGSCASTIVSCDRL